MLCRLQACSRAGSAHTHIPQRAQTLLFHFITTFSILISTTHELPGMQGWRKPEQSYTKQCLCVIRLCLQPASWYLHSLCWEAVIAPHSWHRVKPLKTCYPGNFGLCMSHTHPQKYLTTHSYEKTQRPATRKQKTVVKNQRSADIRSIYCSKKGLHKLHTNEIRTTSFHQLFLPYHAQKGDLSNLLLGWNPKLKEVKRCLKAMGK